MKPYIAVVGGTNADLCGRPFSAPVPGDSNPGEVSFSLGGVGRNIAHDLCLLGADTVLLTALGEDAYAGEILRSCGEIGLDVSRALLVPGEKTSTYLYLCDERGNMLMAVSDMALSDRITPDYLAREKAALLGAELIVADANLPEKTLKWLSNLQGPPLFVDPVSTKKAEKLREVLGGLHTLKANRIEAEILSGAAIQDEESLREAARKLLGAGLKRVFITLGSEGSLAADESGLERVPCCPAKLVNVTGAGDAFMAAVAWAWPRGMALRETAEFASAAAAIAVEYAGTNPPNLSVRAALAKAEQIPCRKSGSARKETEQIRRTEDHRS